MKFIAIKTNDGEYKGNIAFCYKMLHVSRQGFYKYLVNKDRPWKYQTLAEAIQQILKEDECNDTYYRIMEEIGLSHRPKHKPNGITKADREARKSEDLLKRDFKSEQPLTKCVTDITEIKASNGKLYVSAIFGCVDASVIGLAMDTNMRAPPYVCKR